MKIIHIFDPKHDTKSQYSPAPIRVDKLPSMCPYCNKSVEYKIIYGFSDEDNDFAQVILKCPAEGCGYYTLATYEKTYIIEKSALNPDYYLRGTIPSKVFIKRKFEAHINEISPSFNEIYNQSLQAEQSELSEICGAGYRKALEFLIKDFIASEKPELIEKVRKMLLGNCIKEYVDDPRIKDVAKRAVWLGNDETHYVREWTNKDIKDMKTLIDLTIYWISSHILTKQYKDEMP